MGSPSLGRSSSEELVRQVLVVQVLPMSDIVGADRLQVPVPERCDPHLLPGRWYRQMLYAVTSVGVGHRDAVGVR
jgi:hypothetical protein